MPYRRKYRGKGRKRKYLSKARIKSKTGAKSQASQIVSLQRQIKDLNVRVGDADQYCQYLHQYTESGGAPVDLTSGRMTCWPIIQPDKWNGIFQSDSRTDNTNKFRGRSLGIQTQFVLGNTEVAQPPMPVFVYIVSLRAERGEQFINDLGAFTDNEKETGKLWPDTGANTFVNKYYSRRSVEEGVVENMNSLIFLNKGVFKIHYFKRFIIGNQLNWDELPEDNKVSTNIKDANKMFYHKQSFQNLITPPIGKWKDMAYEDLATKDQLYLLVHYDKPTVAENDLTVSANVVITGKTTN